MRNLIGTVDGAVAKIVIDKSIRNEAICSRALEICGEGYQLLVEESVQRDRWFETLWKWE